MDSNPPINSDTGSGINWQVTTSAGGANLPQSVENLPDYLLQEIKSTKSISGTMSDLTKGAVFHKKGNTPEIVFTAKDIKANQSFQIEVKYNQTPIKTKNTKKRIKALASQKRDQTFILSLHQQKNKELYDALNDKIKLRQNSESRERNRSLGQKQAK